MGKFQGKPSGDFRRELRQMAINDSYTPKPFPKNRGGFYNPDFDPKTAYETFAKGLDIPAVCVALDIGRQTYYDWITKYPEFKQAVEMGKEAGELYWDAKARDHLVITQEKDGDKVTFNTDLYKFTKRVTYKAKDTDSNNTFIVNGNADEEKLKALQEMVKNLHKDET